MPWRWRWRKREKRVERDRRYYPLAKKGCLQEMKTFDVEMGSLQHSYPLSGGSYGQATVLRDNDGEGDSLIPPPALAHSLGKTKRL